MIFWSKSRKRPGGRGASRTFGVRVSVTLILFSLAFIPVVATHAEQWQQFDAHGYINDFAGVLDAATVEKLTRLCGEVDQKAKAQIAVVTINPWRAILKKTSRTTFSRSGAWATREQTEA